MKLSKLLIAVVAGVTLSLATTYNVSASKKPNYAYTLTRTKQHNVKLTNTGKTESMYRVTVKRVSKNDEKRNADPRNHFTPAGIKNTQRTVWNR